MTRAGGRARTRPPGARSRRAGPVALALLALLVVAAGTVGLAGCASRATGTAGTAGTPGTVVVLTPSPTAARSAARSATPSPTSSPTPSPVLCPGETPARTSATASARPDPAYGDGGPPDWADNNAFRNPFPLSGALRCEGLADSKRIQAALDVLRVGHHVGLDAVRERLVALGYPADKVTVLPNGEVSVDFTVDLSPRMCLEGSVDPSATKAEAFGGYPDSTNCQPHPSGH
ncbi:hypothetical protein ACEZCY_05480 [Streptacidiphilus sp. N1-12]|uniref:Uncharacterized protein n=2 Tax=Streptacidiphilus alkalitolerans TaxID=3342712 RepID=A0ABV6WAA0_9ACTN